MLAKLSWKSKKAKKKPLGGGLEAFKYFRVRGDRTRVFELFNHHHATY